MTSNKSNIPLFTLICCLVTYFVADQEVPTITDTVSLSEPTERNDKDTVEKSIF